MKKNILITGPYLPGKSFGGPVKSLYNMVESLGDDYNFYIITGDRDLNSKVQYDNVTIGEWNAVGKAKVLYVPDRKNIKYIMNSISNHRFDIIYCSSFFSKSSVLIQLMKYIKKIKIPVIISPRGEFAPAALSLKSFKKKLYILLYKIFKINKSVVYTCTSENDKENIRDVLGKNTDIIIAGNIVYNDNYENKKRVKKSGFLNIATVSRISRIKNIDYSLKLLKEISNSEIDFKKINFDIYGPIEDKLYYRECLEIIKKLNKKIEVRFMGSRDYNQIIDILSKYHIFLFPTKGENFGHVIQEALLSGCPVIISDQTPWKRLEKLEVGYDIGLKEKNEFIKSIIKFIKMDNQEYNLFSNKAFNYALDRVKNQNAITENIYLFDKTSDKQNL